MVRRNPYLKFFKREKRVLIQFLVLVNEIHKIKRILCDCKACVLVNQDLLNVEVSLVVTYLVCFSVSD